MSNSALRLSDIKKGNRFFEIHYGLKINMVALEDCKFSVVTINNKELIQYSLLVKWDLPHGSGETVLTTTESYEGYGPRLYLYE